MEYVVVVNDEDQHSIWPANSSIPAGWRPASEATDRETCLKLIEERWVDIRPKILRDSLNSGEE